jgi:hypothetical protein
MVLTQETNADSKQVPIPQDVADLVIVTPEKVQMELAALRAERDQAKAAQAPPALVPRALPVLAPRPNTIAVEDPTSKERGLPEAKERPKTMAAEDIPSKRDDTESKAQENDDFDGDASPDSSMKKKIPVFANQHGGLNALAAAMRASTVRRQEDSHNEHSPVHSVTTSFSKLAGSNSQLSEGLSSSPEHDKVPREFTSRKAPKQMFNSPTAHMPLIIKKKDNSTSGDDVLLEKVASTYLDVT